MGSLVIWGSKFISLMSSICVLYKKSSKDSDGLSFLLILSFSFISVFDLDLCEEKSDSFWNLILFWWKGFFSF